LGHVLSSRSPGVKMEGRSTYTASERSATRRANASASGSFGNMLLKRFVMAALYPLAGQSNARERLYAKGTQFLLAWGRWLSRFVVIAVIELSVIATQNQWAAGSPGLTHRSPGRRAPENEI
jgi:hypothetical protein